MEAHLPLLREIPLFAGMADEEILRVLTCLRARELRFDRAQLACELDEQPFLGVVIEGGLMAHQADLRGNRSILGDYGPGDFLDGAARAEESTPLYYSVRAHTAVILLENGAAMAPCQECCRAHLLFLRNVARAMALEKANLLRKLEHLSKRSTREKIVSYLETQSALQGTRKVHVPYTRQELADILAVDRSAMCSALTSMQKDGVLRYERKRFELLGG